MKARAIGAVALAVLPLTAAACGEIIRYDFEASDATGAKLRGSFTLALDGASDDDPLRGSYRIQSAAVEGQPARGEVLVFNDVPVSESSSPLLGFLPGFSTPPDDPSVRPRDAFVVALFVDESPSTEVVISLLDPTAQAFGSDAVPFPFPGLERFGRSGLLGPDQVMRAGREESAPQFKGRLDRIVARSVRPPVRVPVE